MFNFPLKKASARSISRRKPVYGVGINDSDYVVTIKINNKRKICPIYKIWANMLKRCYCNEFQIKNPAYNGCKVVSWWRTFSHFRIWVITQDWQGKDLDKDFIFSNNKIYSPSSCLFVNSDINRLVEKRTISTGPTAYGTYLDKRRSLFVARCSVRSKDVWIGSYKKEKEAGEAFLKFKSNHVHEIALQQTDERLKQALIRISGEISRGEYYQ
jgi:hypothetical protein